MIKNLDGQKFGRWTVLRRDDKRPRYWHCRCDCGTERSVFNGNFRTGESASCGCARADRMLACNHRHGLTGTPEYAAWSEMKKRCYNTNSHSFPNYGGRGITVCDEWRYDVVAFVAYIGRRPSPSHSIGRIDNNLGYQPGNVRWETLTEQANNKRSVARIIVDGQEESAHIVAGKKGLTGPQYRHRVERGWPAEVAATTPRLKNRVYSHDGRNHTLRQWATMSGIPIRTLRARIDTLGWTTYRALTTPVR